MPIPENVRGTGDFRKHPENINRKGRPVSIKSELQKVLLKDGELPIPKDQLTRETETHYIFKIPTQEAMALKLATMAMSKGSNGFNALKLLLETFDGKAKQSIQTNDTSELTALIIKRIEPNSDNKST